MKHFILSLVLTSAASLLSAQVTPDPVNPYLHFAAGVTAAVTDANGITWLPDSLVVANAGNSLPWTVTFPSGHPSPGVPYNSLRFGSTVSYKIPVPDLGGYWLVFYLLEPTQNAVGLRQFTIKVNGEIQAYKVDVFALAGSMNAPTVLEVPVENVTGTVYVDISTDARSFVVSGFALYQRPSLSDLISSIIPPATTAPASSSTPPAN